MGRPFPPSKLPIHVGESGPLCNTWFHRPTRAHIPNDISVGSVVFAALTIVTDGPTDRATLCVAIGPVSYIRISLCYFYFRWKGICCLQIYNRL